MSNPDIEVSRVIYGTDFLAACAEFDFVQPDPEGLISALERGALAGLVARLGGTAIGTVFIGMGGVAPGDAAFYGAMQKIDPEGKTPPIYALKVSDEYPHQGGGTALMLAAEKVIIQDRSLPNKVCLTVQTTAKPALKLYKKLGYEDRGMIIVEDALIPDDQDGWGRGTVESVVMTKDLQSE